MAEARSSPPSQAERPVVAVHQRGRGDEGAGQGQVHGQRDRDVGREPGCRPAAPTSTANAADSSSSGRGTARASSPRTTRVTSEERSWGTSSTWPPVHRKRRDGCGQHQPGERRGLAGVAHQDVAASSDDLGQHQQGEHRAREREHAARTARGPRRRPQRQRVLRRGQQSGQQDDADRGVAGCAAVAARSARRPGRPRRPPAAAAAGCASVRRRVAGGPTSPR